MLDPAKLTLNMAAVAGLALLAACTSTQSQEETAGAMLPQPSVVIVETFASPPTRSSWTRA